MTTPKGKAVKHRNLIRRLFNGLPVIDSKRELRVFASDDDIKEAKQKNPTNCVFANACKRLFGSHNAAFFRTCAYVELPDEKGNLRIERFWLTKSAQDSILVFDTTGKADPGGYVLSPPSKSLTLDRKMQYARERPKSTTITWTPHKKRSKAKNDDYRSGTGLVQFIRAQKNWVRP